jgi:23S rRNA (guanosine2251-2'-O)-methyltransferase
MKEKLAGINSIMEALKGPRKVHKIYIQENRQGKRIQEIIRIAHQKGVFIQYVEKQRLDQIYRISNHQGIVAQVDNYEYSNLDTVFEFAALKRQSPFLLILDGLEDPQNLGNIIRTAESAGVHGIVIPRHNSSEVTTAVAKASAGAVEHMHIVQETNIVNTIKDLKGYGLWIVGADMNADPEYYSIVLPDPIGLVIGGEGKGIRRLVKEHCDFMVKIPMWGKVSSLNASTAAALLIYEVVRQRSQSGRSQYH